MNRILFQLLIVIIASLISCGDGHEPLLDMNGVDTAKFVRSEADAIDQALADRENFFGKPNSLSRSERDKIQAILVKSNVASRSDAINDYYVVNYPDSAGFAVVPVSKRLSTLVVTESGRYGDPDFNGNEALKDYMESLGAYIAYSQNPGDINPGPFTPIQTYEFLKFDTIYSRRIEPRIPLQWGQQGPFAKYCKNGIIGCTPLAVFMVAAYFEQPKTMTAKFDDVNTLMYMNWTEIKKHVKEYPTEDCEASTHEQGAMFCRQIGEIGESKYENKVTKTPTENLIKILKKLYPSVSLDETKFSATSSMEDILSAPLIIHGDGHTFIADGCISEYIREAIYTALPTVPPILTLKEYGSEFRREYLHINWGWDGLDNGYYTAGVFDTVSGNHIKDDNEANGSEQEHTSHQYDAQKLSYIKVAL